MPVSIPAEWRHGRAGRVTLSDEDRTVVTGAGGWRALNTLAHYGVRDSAVMALIPRQNDSFSSNCKYLECLEVFGEGNGSSFGPVGGLRWVKHITGGYMLS